MRSPVQHLYVHVPFCRRKCDYCAFFSVPDPAPEMVARYLRRLAQECRDAAATAGELRTVYFGGGTPTFLSRNELRSLIHLPREFFRLAPDAEISSECNPETLDDEKAEVLAAAVNRVSLGVQSFRAEFRRRLGRHGPAPIRRAVKRLLAHGINNLGLDLIYGIPGQSLADWEAELDLALALPIRHLSAYALTLEKGTRLARRTAVAPADDDLLADMWQLAGEKLAAAGMPRYEISNHAWPGAECRHNLAVWGGQPYLGLGPAAGAFDGTTRWSRPADLAAWLAGTPPLPDRLTRPARAREIFAFGLRTSQGWKAAAFWRATGCHWRSWQERLAPLVTAGLLVDDGHGIRPTVRGMQLWDSIAAALI